MQRPNDSEISSFHFHMTPDSSGSHDVWSGTLKSLAVGLCVFYVGRVLAVWLTVHNVHGFSAFLDNVAAALIAGLMVLLYERSRYLAVYKLRESEDASGWSQIPHLS